MARLLLLGGMLSLLPRVAGLTTTEKWYREVCQACDSLKSVNPEREMDKNTGRAISSALPTPSCFTAMADACQYDPSLDPIDNKEVEKTHRLVRQPICPFALCLPTQSPSLDTLWLRQFSFCIGFMATTREDISIGAMMRLLQWKARVCTSALMSSQTSSEQHDEV